MSAASQTDLEKAIRILEWVTNNYKATLAGKSVRDADECLEAADLLLRGTKK